MSIIRFNSKEDEASANYFAQMELNDVLGLLDVVEESLSRSILFQDTNFKQIKIQMIDEMLKRCFEKNGQSLKQKYVTEFCEKYENEVTEEDMKLIENDPELDDLVFGPLFKAMREREEEKQKLQKRKANRENNKPENDPEK